MRVAYVVADGGIPVFGSKGASVHVREFVRALGSEHTVDLFCASSGDGHCDLPVRRLSEVAPPQVASQDNGPARRDRRRLGGVKRMKSVLQEVCQTETYDLLYERYSLFSDAGAQVADMWGIPFMLEVNAPLIEERRRFEELPLAPLAETIERRVFQQADAILAVSRAVADHVMNRGANPDRVHIVPNAVDVTRFHPAVSGERVRSSLCPGATLLVGFVGSLKAWHGVDLLLPAFACASQQQWRLLIVGDGPERSRLESRADALGIRHKVVFTGAVPHSEVPEYIAALDIAVAPYDQFPNFYFSPLKLYEYLAMGKAVVASNIGQIADRVRHGDNGYLVPPEDEIALAEALRTLGNNDSLRAELGQRAPLHLQTWSQVANQTISICRQLRGEHARP